MMLNRAAKVRCGIVPLIVALAWPVLAATPTALKATFRSGQVFLVWKEAANATEYRVYRDAAPLGRAALDEKHLVRKVPQGSSRHLGFENMAGRKCLRKNDPPFDIMRYVVDPIPDDAVGNAKALAEDEGVLVLTTKKAGAYHYAVTAVVNGAEDKTLAAGNAAGPVAEKVETPAPLLIWQSKIKCARVYLQYRDLDDWNDSMSNVYAFPYWVGVRKNHKPGPRTKQLRVYLGGYSGPIGGGNSARYADVCIRTHEAGCWWWGFSSTYQYNRKKFHIAARDPKPDKGPMKNYVQGRYVDFVRWLIAQPYYSIDPDAVHTFGGSMGGVGSLLMLMDHPDVFAWGQACVPPTNMLGVKWQWLRNCEAKWGPAGATNITVAFHGWGADRLNKRWPGMTVTDFLNLEKRLAMMEGDDLPFFWLGSAGRDGSVNWPAQGRNYYTALNATRHAWAGGLKGGSGHFGLGGDGGGIRISRQRRTIKRNHAFPAFSNVSGNPKLPLPLRPERKFYQFNSQFMWSTPTFKVGGWQKQVDTKERFEMIIACTAGVQTADVTLRRTQKFRPVVGKNYLLQHVDVKDGEVLQSQTAIADKFGLLTYKEFPIRAGGRNAGGSKLVITPAK